MSKLTCKICLKEGMELEINTLEYILYFVTDLKRIELQSQVTKFWRHQRDKPDTYLATVEAVYYFLREYHQHYVSQQYEGQYDNLLFLFCFMYKKIKRLYDGGKELKAYKKKSE